MKQPHMSCINLIKQSIPSFVLSNSPFS